MSKQIALLCKRRYEFSADSTDLLFPTSRAGEDECMLFASYLL